MPCLRHMALENITSWTNNIFSQLTHLFLRGRCVDGFIQTIHEYRELLELLRGSPGLQVLFLSLPDPWIPENMEEIGDKVEVLNLRKMRVDEATPHQIHRLMSNLVLPHSVCLSVSPSRYSGRICVVDNILPKEITPTLHLLLDDITSIEMDFIVPTENVRDDSVLDRLIGVGPAGAFYTHACYASSAIYTTSHRLQAIEASIRRLHTFKNLTEIWIDGPDTEQLRVWLAWDPNTDIWRPAFAGLARLEKLVLQNSLFLDVVTALAPPSDFKVDPAIVIAASVTPCPYLISLWVAAETDTLMNARRNLCDFASRRHIMTGQPFPQLLLRSTTGTSAEARMYASLARVRGDDDETGFVGLQKHVATFAFVDKFPTGRFELPAMASESCIRMGREYWPKWREDMKE
ncbi:hypothetical protein BXZ70DRAFT_670698 [Cristinia sonorae]|uniref:Uncharacterized protein n=1 Tax=Cristinia sonorae TaxID=1940300 RepID=A0A8K0UTU7_9AGAR|nr:hypothetical protein BXZ70DRAFT_670698 [Cristinia sonorae]